jgi:hypothetical protein
MLPSHKKQKSPYTRVSDTAYEPSPVPWGFPPHLSLYYFRLLCCHYMSLYHKQGKTFNQPVSVMNVAHNMSQLVDA